MAKKEQFVKVCPQCGSPDIITDFSQAGLVAGGLMGYECNNCGHTASVFPEMPMSEVKEPKKKEEVKSTKQHVVYAKGNNNFLKALGPVGILLGIVASFYQLFFGLSMVLFFGITTIIVFNYNEEKAKKIIIALHVIGYVLTLVLSVILGVFTNV